VIACIQNIEVGRLDELVEHCSAHNVALVKFHYALESAVTKKFEVLEV
jgi:hypothetical protein